MQLLWNVGSKGQKQKLHYENYSKRTFRSVASRLNVSFCVASDVGSDDWQRRRWRLCLDGLCGLLRCVHERVSSDARPALDRQVRSAEHTSHQLHDYHQRTGRPVRDQTMERRWTATRSGVHRECHTGHSRPTMASHDRPTGTGLTHWCFRPPIIFSINSCFSRPLPY